MSVKSCLFNFVGMYFNLPIATAEINLGKKRGFAQFIKTIFNSWERKFDFFRHCIQFSVIYAKPPGFVGFLSQGNRGAEFAKAVAGKTMIV